MAARLAKMAANMAATFSRSAIVASGRAQSQIAAGSGRLAPGCVFPVRAFRSPLCAAPGTKIRDFSASAAPPASAPETVAPIVDVVKEELSYEKENYAKPQMTPLPEGWTLSEKAGDSKVTLTREFGDEIVQVDFTARQLEDDEDEYEEEEEGEEDAAGEDDIVPMDEVSIEVAVMKANSDKALVFEAETNGDYLRILDVSLESVSSTEEGGDGAAAAAAAELEGGEDDDTLYRGPVFSELDDKLQQAFMSFLSERGVNAELGQFIIEFSDDKEQREYMHWLEGVHSFLKS